MTNRDYDRRNTINRIEKIYRNLEKILDSLPKAFPSAMKDQIKDLVLGDDELKKIIEDLEGYRPPKFFLIGRTGVGKSSLVNAINGRYLAPVNDVYAQTRGVDIYDYKQEDQILLQILDTRGLSESLALDDNISAEEMIKKELRAFLPDLCLFMLNASHRDDIGRDVRFIKNLCEDYKKNSGVELPVICIINKVDELAPSRFKDPSQYPLSKTKNINEVVSYYGDIIKKEDLKLESIIAVSSLMDWKLDDEFIDADRINDLAIEDLERLELAFDGRYKIDELIDALEDAIVDYKAVMGLRIACRMDKIMGDLADKLTQIFSAFSATIALTPIPVADLYPLFALQVVLVTLIAGLSARDISLKSSKEFIMSIGGVGIAANIFRFSAQQLSKFLNIFSITAGSAVSASVAAFGTKAIGEAAKNYYIDGIDIKKVKKELRNKIKKVKTKKN